MSCPDIVGRPETIMETRMNDQFTRQAQDMLAAAKEARIPENVQAFAEESVAKTRDAYTKLNAATQDSVKAVEEIVLAAQAGAKSFSEKFIHAATTNAEAAFDAAEAIAKAKTLPEVARLQADFFKQQLAAASSQTKEFFDLSNKISRQTLESMNSAATKTFEQFKKVG
jgi:phasin